MANATNPSVQGTKDKVKDAASSVVNQASDMASKAGDMASKAVGQAGDMASKAASKVGETADSAASTVGGGLHTAANAIRDNLPREGMVGSAAEGVASTLETGAKYLQDQGLTGMSDDIAGVIKRYPIPAVLLAVGLGYLIACGTSSSSRS